VQTTNAVRSDSILLLHEDRRLWSRRRNIFLFLNESALFTQSDVELYAAFRDEDDFIRVEAVLSNQLV